MQEATTTRTWPDWIASQFLPGAADLYLAGTRFRLWLTLAWEDVRLKYKRSILGPFWIVVATGFFVAVMGYLWTAILNRDLHLFLPWYAIGLTIWRYITSNLSDAANTFVNAASTIQTIPMPLSVHVYRMITKNLFIFGNNALIVVGVMIYFLIPITPTSMLVIPGLLILAATSVVTSVLFGLIGARYRDFGHAVSMAMTPLFFVTPVLWMPDMATGHRAKIMLLNPFQHFLAVVREPLLGRVPTALNYEVTLGILLIMGLAAVNLLSRKKKRVPYWL